MGAVTRSTETDRRVDEIAGRVARLEDRMGTMEIGQAEMRAELGAHAQRSDDFRAQTRQDLGEVKAQGSQTQAMLKEWMDAERARKDAEDAHRREMATVEAKAKGEAAQWYRSLLTPQVLGGLILIAATAAGIQVPGIAAMLGLTQTPPAGQAAATGIMGAGVAPVSAPAE